MQKKFVSNLLFLLFLNLAIKPFWMLGIEVEVQNTVGTEEYGHYFALMSFSFLLNIILDAGLTNYNNRNISRYQFLVAKHFSALFTLKLILGIAYFIVAGIIAVLIGFHRGSWLLLVLLFLNQFFVYLIFYLRSNLAGLQLFKYDSIVSVLDRFLMIIFVGILLITQEEYGLLTIKTFVISQTIAYAMVALIVIGLIFRKVGRVKFTFKPHFSRVIIKKSLPYAILVLLMTFYNRMDPVMLKWLLPASEGELQAGIYAHGYRLLDSVVMIAFLFSTLLLPMFSSMLKRQEPVQGLVETSFKLLMSGVIMIGVLCFSFSDHIIRLLYKEHIEESSVVFSLLILSLIPISVTYIFGTLLTANGNLKWLNRMAIFGVMLNIGMNFILIPSYKALGTAASSLATQLITALVQVVMAVRFVHVQVSGKLILSVVLYTLGLFLLAQILLWAPLDVSVWTKFAASIAGGLLFALALGLISVKAALSLLKTKTV